MYELNVDCSHVNLHKLSQFSTRHVHHISSQHTQPTFRAPYEWARANTTKKPATHTNSLAGWLVGAGWLWLGNISMAWICSEKLKERERDGACARVSCGCWWRKIADENFGELNYHIMNTKLSTTVSSKSYTKLSTTVASMRACMRLREYTLARRADKVDNRLHDLCAETHRQIQLAAGWSVLFLSLYSFQFHPCLCRCDVTFNVRECPRGLLMFP